MMKVELSGIPFLFDNDLKNGKEIHKHCFNCFTMMMRHFLVYFISSNLNLIKPNSMCKSHFDSHYIVCIKTRVSNASGFYLCAIASFCAAQVNLIARNKRNGIAQLCPTFLRLHCNVVFLYHSFLVLTVANLFNSHFPTQ